MQTINILRPVEEGQVTTKTFVHRDGRIDEHAYQSGMFFAVEQAQAGSIFELSALLMKLEYDRQAFIIQGELLPEMMVTTLLDEGWYGPVRRTIRDIPETGQKAFFREYQMGTCWFMLDFDKIILPAGMTPDEGVKMMVAKLPPEFQNVTYHYQLSSSAGVYGWDNLSAHVFFWLAQPFKGVKRWGKNFNAKYGAEYEHKGQIRHRNIIDPSTLDCEHVNYTAAPVFDGLADPLAGLARSRLVRGLTHHVSLSPIPDPDVFFVVGGVRMKAGDMVTIDGRKGFIYESFQDKLDAIGHPDYYPALRTAIASYCAVNGTLTDPEELKQIIRAHWDTHCNGAGPSRRHYMSNRVLDDLIRGALARFGAHTPKEKVTDEELQDRIQSLRGNRRPFPDEAEIDEALPTGQELELEISGLSYKYIEGECGEGKTEFVLDLIAEHPKRYICAFPTIKLILDVKKRLDEKHKNFRGNLNYKFRTIYSDKKTDIRDDDDEPDDTKEETVTSQIAKFRRVVDKRRYPNVVLFITHAALFQANWQEWKDFELVIDEVPEPYITWTRKFTRHPADLTDAFEVARDEGNYYRLALTDDMSKILENDDDEELDDIDGIMLGMMDAIRSPNVALYANKVNWDNVTKDKIRFVRLVDPHFLDAFPKVTIMGDEFTRSLLAQVWSYTHGVIWEQRTDWRPQVRVIPLKSRVHIHYFAGPDDIRASRNMFRDTDDDRNIMRTIKNWMLDNIKVPTLITTNKEHKNLFLSDGDVTSWDEETEDGIVRHSKTINPTFLWQPPRLQGINTYIERRSVAWMAAMRPNGQEIGFLREAVGLTENDIIRWREYNALYQFIMRICFREFKSAAEGHVYVFDYMQANYLKERFGGCLSMTHHNNVFGDILKSNKRGPKTKDPSGKTQAGAERTAASRARAKEREAEAKEALKRKREAEDTGKPLRRDLAALARKGRD